MASHRRRRFLDLKCPVSRLQCNLLTRARAIDTTGTTFCREAVSRVLLGLINAYSFSANSAERVSFIRLILEGTSLNFVGATALVTTVTSETDRIYQPREVLCCRFPKERKRYKQAVPRKEKGYLSLRCHLPPLQWQSRRRLQHKKGRTCREQHLGPYGFLPSEWSRRRQEGNLKHQRQSLLRIKWRRRPRND